VNFNHRARLRTGSERIKYYSIQLLCIFKLLDSARVDSISLLLNHFQVFQMTKKFFISYDLTHATNADYQRIESVLIKVNAERVLINLWFYEGTLYENTVNVRNALLPCFKANDRLLVIDAKDWAWYNALT
jgi:hypothetical protein